MLIKQKCLPISEVKLWVNKNCFVPLKPGFVYRQQQLMYRFRNRVYTALSLYVNLTYAGNSLKIYLENRCGANPG